MAVLTHTSHSLFEVPKVICVSLDAENVEEQSLDVRCLKKNLYLKMKSQGIDLSCSLNNNFEFCTEGLFSSLFWSQRYPNHLFNSNNKVCKKLSSPDL